LPEFFISLNYLIHLLLLNFDHLPFLSYAFDSYG
jgi:hypothetical protein